LKEFNLETVQLPKSNYRDFPSSNLPVRRQILHRIFQRDKPAVFVVMIGKLFEQLSFIAIIFRRKLNFAGKINQNKFSIESF